MRRKSREKRQERIGMRAMVSSLVLAAMIIGCLGNPIMVQTASALEKGNHYLIEYEVPDDSRADAPTSTHSEPYNGVEIIGGAANQTPRSKDEYYAPVELPKGGFWCTDPNDESTEVDYYTEISGNTTLYCNFIEVNKLVEEVNAIVNATPGYEIPIGWVEDPFYSQDPGKTFVTAPKGTDYRFAGVLWDNPDDDQYFVPGKTYRFRVQVVAAKKPAEALFKGWTKARFESNDGIVSNPQDCFTVKVNGVTVNRGDVLGICGIDLETGQGGLFDGSYTVPNEKPTASVGKTTIRNTIANTVANPKYKDVIFDAVPGATSYDLAYRHKNVSSWTYKNDQKSTRIRASGLTVKSLYHIKVRAKKAETATHRAAVGAWSAEVYRYFFTVQKIRLKSSSKGSFTMSWNKDPDATGHQVMYCTNSNGKGAANNIRTISKNSITSYTQKGLKSGTTYYVQVRALKKVGNTTYIGNISCPVAVKVK